MTEQWIVFMILDDMLTLCLLSAFYTWIFLQQEDHEHSMTKQHYASTP